MIRYKLPWKGIEVDLEITSPDTIEIPAGVATATLVAYLRVHKAAIIKAACENEWASWKAELARIGTEPIEGVSL